MRKEHNNFNKITKRKSLLLIFIMYASVFTTFYSTSDALGYADRTYDIAIEVYCNPNAGQDICGHPVPTPNHCCFMFENDLYNFIENHSQLEMYYLNEIWKPIGISFRISDININLETNYSTISDPEDSRIIDLKDWAKANNEDKITLFILQNLDVGGFSQAAIYNPSAYPSDYYGVFTRFFPLGGTLAHELGHHFCLGHPHTWKDPADDGDDPSIHDEGLADTALDPGPIETDISEPGFDIYVSGGQNYYVIDHEWCLPWYHGYGLDPNSPYKKHCTVECYRSVSQFNAIPTPFYPQTELIMSYYGGCNGPYVFSGGHRVEAFTLDQKDRIRNLCLTTVTERQNYNNVCADWLGGDSDHDGICNFFDMCPDIYNATYIDSDGDYIPDDCDNCPNDPNSNQVDTDEDTVGDACDEDWDNDGCPNDWDDDPHNNQQIIGYYYHPFCPEESSLKTGFAGENSDGTDGLNCWIFEVDDDDDKIPDSNDPCPTVYDPDPENPDPSLCTEIMYGCPFYEEEPCFFSCGDRFFIKLVSRINPSDFITFDKLAISGNMIYLGMLPGKTLSETARVLTGAGFMAVGLGTAASSSSFQFDDPPLALELWSRSPEEKVRLLAEYYPDSVLFGDDIAHGRALAVQVINTGEGELRELSINATWVFGLAKDNTVSDGDGDGVPDLADNCQDASNPKQDDSDKDGFGDICDPDFDQNGIVTEEEVVFIHNCEGTDLTIPAQYSDRVEPANIPLIERIEALECRKADLDGDNDVDEDDCTLAANLLGERPGPSGIDGKIPQDTDQCPASDTSPYIVIDDCSTGVENQLFSNGCTILDKIAECALGAKNHGDFVNCVSHMTNELKRLGLITGGEKESIQSCAAQADIP